MTTPRTKVLKKAGMKNIKGHFGKSVLAFLLLCSVFVFIAVLEGVLREALRVPYLVETEEGLRYNRSLYNSLFVWGNLLLFFLLYEPMRLSMKGYFLNASCGKRLTVASLFDAFSGFRGFIASVALGIKLALLKFFWMLVLFGPPALLAFLCALCLKQVVPDTMRVALKAALVFLAVLELFECFLLSFVLCRYFLAPYLLISNNASSAKEALQKSKRLMKGRVSKAFFLQLSFFGWRRLYIFLLPALYIVPAYEAARAELAKNILLEALKKRAE